MTARGPVAGRPGHFFPENRGLTTFTPCRPRAVCYAASVRGAGRSRRSCSDRAGRRRQL